MSQVKHRCPHDGVACHNYICNDGTNCERLHAGYFLSATTPHQIASMVDAVATRSGFDPTTWENFPAKMMMAITELDELVDGVRGRQDDHPHEELADTTIRILASAHTLSDGKWVSRLKTRFNNQDHWWDSPVVGKRWLQPPEVEVWAIVSMLSKATETWRRGNRGEALQYLELAILECFRLADRIGFSLVQEILVKTSKNMKRPRLHGKVESVG